MKKTTSSTSGKKTNPNAGKGTNPRSGNETDPRAEISRINIRMAAALRDINLSEVSRQSGMSRNGLGQFVAGRTSLSYANMLKVCDVLQIPIGIVHRQDAITENKIRLYRLLDRMPDHLAAIALAEAQKVAGVDF